MDKLTLSAALLALLLGSCQRHHDDLQLPEPSVEPPTALTTQELDSQIMERLRATGRYNWNEAPAHVVWSALTQSDYVLSVGYRPAGFSGALPNDVATNPDWQAARAQVLALITAEEQKADPTLTVDKLVAFQESALPVLDVTVHQLTTIKALRASGLVRYAEPMGYEPNHTAAVANRTASSLSSSGCGNNTATAGLVAGTDYAVLSNGSKSS
ncbi:hypothetical protein GCM10022409_30320 [Hymenobacter glaciei]|uniref:Uncharacterized protein n=1 Tax=Hymenobacter glaciei TaxID=877209 RepID=A0ABP7UHR5_9BACT